MSKPFVSSVASGGSGGTIRVRSLGHADDSKASQLFTNISVCNAGGTAMSLDGVAVKYWYTADGAAFAQVAMVDMAPISPVPTATATLFDLSEFRVNADAVLAMKFGATTLAAGACTGSIQLRVYAQGYLCCYAAQAGDYSYVWNRAPLRHLPIATVLAPIP